MKNKKWILAKRAILFTTCYIGILFLSMLIELMLTKKITTDYVPFHVIGFSFYMGILAAFGAFNSIDKKTMVNKDKEDEK